MKCPRERETGMPSRHKTHWRADGTCSYCGSISPERLFAAIESDCMVTPTDKDYKIYIDVPHPDAGKPCILSSANFEQKGEGWVQITSENRATLPLDDYQRKNYPDGHWVQLQPRGPMDRVKFYFQHLSEEEMQRFIDLYNAKRIKLDHPGHFYVSPFFMTIATVN